MQAGVLARDGQPVSAANSSKAKGVHVVVYEPTLDASDFYGNEVTHDLGTFKGYCVVIVANRWNDDLSDVAHKVYTRDLFRRD